MEQVNIREFKSRLSFYLNNLPIEITNRGVVVARVTSPEYVHMEMSPASKPVSKEEFVKEMNNVQESKLERARKAMEMAESSVGLKPMQSTREPLKVEMSNLEKCYLCGRMAELFPHKEEEIVYKPCGQCYFKIMKRYPKGYNVL